MLQGVTFHALESRNDGVLWDVQPSFVVMVDSDVAFVRQLEVIEASHFVACRTHLTPLACVTPAQLYPKTGSSYLKQRWIFRWKWNLAQGTGARDRYTK